jgi:carbon-monoxide dehydrogenase medium subunit
VKPSAFAYHAPGSAKEAVDLLAELGDGAKVIAGGQSLVPVLAMRLAAFDHLVDIRRVAGLRGIEERGASGGGALRPAISREGERSIPTCPAQVWIGAGTTQASIGQSRLVAAAVPLLARATPLIGHFQIRNRGTIGGSLAHADAAAEYPAVALALDARLETLSPRGQRSIPAAEFFTGIWSTALAADELLTGVTFPAAGGSGQGPGRPGFAIEELARRPGDFAVAGAAVAVWLSDDGTRVDRCGIGLFGLGPTPLRAAGAQACAAGRAVADVTAAEVGQAAMAGLESVPSDLHGSAGYRKRVGAAIVATAWARAVKEAEGARERRQAEGAPRWTD